MSGFKIKFDEQNFDYDCDGGDTLLRGALRSGLGFPYECNSGGCGSCKFELVSGEVEELWSEAPGRTRRDIKKGKLLGCQCRPKTDCVIKANLEHHSVPDQKPERMEISYLGRDDLTSDLSEFHFKSDGPAHFIPGQYALFTLPGVTGDRGYSMSNLPNNRNEWSFIVKNMPGGAATDYLFNRLQVDDRFSIDGPFGLAFLKPEIPRDIVCIAGGSGLSPVISIVRAVAADPRLKDRKVHMFYGGRGPKDICTPDLVGKIEGIDYKLTCYNATSDKEMSEAEGWSGDCCFIHELVERTLAGRMQEFEYYFCGPPPMTDAVQRMLMLDHKVPFDQIHFDRFF